MNAGASRTKRLTKSCLSKPRKGVTSQGLAIRIATKTVALIVVLAVAAISVASLVIIQKTGQPFQTVGSPCGGFVVNPGESVVISNGVQVCIVGPH